MPGHNGGLDEDLSSRLAEVRFRRLYAEHGREILAYAMRRTAAPEDAADALSETFLVAWRRLEDVPAGGDARPWLYGVARNVLANQGRSARRRERLSARLGTELSTALAVPPPPEDRHDGSVIAALAALDPEDREILALVAWEELSPGEAAKALGITGIAARSRLHRARRRLRRRLTETVAAPAESLELEEER